MTDRVVRMRGERGWENAVRATCLVHSVRRHECSLDHAAFKRRQEKWYVWVIYANVDKSLKRVPEDCKSLYTYVRPKGAELEEVWMATRAEGEEEK